MASRVSDVLPGRRSDIDSEAGLALPFVSGVVADADPGVVLILLAVIGL
jgi:hypothetical protein